VVINHWNQSNNSNKWLVSFSLELGILAIKANSKKAHCESVAPPGHWTTDWQSPRNFRSLILTSESCGTLDNT